MKKDKNMKRSRLDESYENGTSHSRDELNAYRAMPELMKMRVKRNTKLWYGTNKYYFPDLLFEDCKVVIEIGGWSHLKSVEYDKERVSPETP